MAKTSASARELTDHEEIRRWAEKRGAKPAFVRGTGDGEDVGMIRLDFPGYAGGDSLEQISWDDWFQKFDESNLALLVQDETARGQQSNFNKLVSRRTSGQGSRAGGRGRAAARTRRAAAGRTWVSGRRASSGRSPSAKSRTQGRERSQGESRGRSTRNRGRSSSPNRRGVRNATKGATRTRSKANRSRAGRAKRAVAASARSSAKIRSIAGRSGARNRGSASRRRAA